MENGTHRDAASTRSMRQVHASSAQPTPRDATEMSALKDKASKLEILSLAVELHFVPNNQDSERHLRVTCPAYFQG